MTDRLGYRISEAATALGVDHETIRRAVVRGEIPARKLGDRIWIIPAEALSAWLEEGYDANRELRRRDDHETPGRSAPPTPDPGRVAGRVVTITWIHDLRGTTATLMREFGVAEDVRMSRLGHTTKAMARHYGQAALGLDRSAADALGDALRGAK